MNKRPVGASRGRPRGAFGVHVQLELLVANGHQQWLALMHLTSAAVNQGPLSDRFKDSIPCIAMVLFPSFGSTSVVEW